MKSLRPTAAVVGLVILLAGTRWIFPERSMGYIGPRALLDAAFALGLLGLVLLLAGGLGRKVLRWLGHRELTALEEAVFALPLGLGIMAYGVLALGLLGWLEPWAILLWLALVGVFTWREWSDLANQFPGWLIRQLRGLKNPELGEKAILLLSGLILGLSLLHALTPPWYYDSLMYHLQAPRLFLEAGRISLLPDLWQANGPFTIEMLYMLGLAWGSDSFARLLHLAYATLLVLAMFGFGKRYLGHWEAWLAVALLVGVPILPLWASAAYADMAWTLYGFLAVYALMLWKERSERRWLLLAGLMMGWALGSKYLALSGLGILELYILWQGRHIGWRRSVSSGALFGAVALCLALPWYAKNWLWSGNPAYPFYVGGTEWDAPRLGQLMGYLGGFGAGQRPLDYLLLPWNLYAQNEKFGTMGAALDFPGLLIPLAFPYPLMPRHKVLDGVACMAGLYFVLWALGSQQTRFLLPIFPALALMGAYVLACIARGFKRWPRATKRLALLLAVFALLSTLFLQLITFYGLPPGGVAMGLQSKDSFLQQRLNNYRALQFVTDNLSPDERVMMLWDGRAYHCDERCLADADQSNWTRLIEPASDPHDVAAQLQAEGVTYLLLNREDLKVVLAHEPSGRTEQAAEFFRKEFLPSCAEEVYRDSYMLLVKIDCGRKSES